MAQDDGAGGGTLSVVDLATFTELDVRPGAGTSALIPDGAGDLVFGLDTDRIWMTIAAEPYAGLVVIDPDGLRHVRGAGAGVRRRRPCRRS